MHLSGGAEMLLIQLNQICWEDQQAWIGQHTKLPIVLNAIGITYLLGKL